MSTSLSTLDMSAVFEQDQKWTLGLEVSVEYNFLADDKPAG
ncbi:hypothetical protein [Fodinibius sp. Rm-B-1B1-1]